ncbi:Cro/CI family transcriptional regulator [Serratia fonticola]|uniref:Cro/CI family transcriptional regulator n=1 Tax=Serratia fonticola TaxID=47917 RepID=UPI00301D0C1A
MYTKDAIAYFKTKAALAKAAGVRKPTVYGWGELVPEGRAARLERLTNGALKYDLSLYQNRDGIHKGTA